MSSFELQPILRGALVELSPLRAEDFEALYGAACDPLIWEQHPEWDRYERPIFERFFAQAMESGGALAVREPGTGQWLGTSRYTEFDPAKREIVIGYTFLIRRVWGQGHNREMKHLMLEHAFRFVDTAVFFVGERNFRSQRAMEKLGARVTGRVEKFPVGGRPRISIAYEISRDVKKDRA